MDSLSDEDGIHGEGAGWIPNETLARVEDISAQQADISAQQAETHQAVESLAVQLNQMTLPTESRREVSSAETSDEDTTYQTNGFNAQQAIALIASKNKEHSEYHPRKPRHGVKYTRDIGDQKRVRFSQTEDYPVSKFKARQEDQFSSRYPRKSGKWKTSTYVNHNPKSERRFDPSRSRYGSRDNTKAVEPWRLETVEEATRWGNVPTHKKTIPVRYNKKKVLRWTDEGEPICASCRQPGHLRRECKSKPTSRTSHLN